MDVAIDQPLLGEALFRLLHSALQVVVVQLLPCALNMSAKIWFLIRSLLDVDSGMFLLFSYNFV